MSKNKKPRIRLNSLYQRAAGKINGAANSGAAKPFPAAQANAYGNSYTQGYNYTPRKNPSSYVTPPKLQVPIVYYSVKAWETVKWLVANCPTELGWVGAVQQVNRYAYIIHDVRVMEQQAGPASFEFDDWNTPVTEMLVKGTMAKGMVDAYLGHSHVNMATRPSGTDEDQLMDMARVDDDTDTPRSKFSIQSIHNKKGDVYMAVYDWENGDLHKNCKVETIPSLSTDDVKDLAQQLLRVNPYKRKTYSTAKVNTPLARQTNQAIIDEIIDDEDEDFHLKAWEKEQEQLYLASMYPLDVGEIDD